MKSILNNIVANRTEAEKFVDKIIEFEIFDPVWFEVLRRHPELQVDETGKTIPLKRNHLMNHFYPRFNTIETIEPYNAIVSVKDLMVTTSITGIFRVLDGKSCSELNSINLFEKLIVRDIPNDFIYAPMSHFHIAGSFAFDTVISSNSIDSSNHIPEESSGSFVTYNNHSRYLLMNIVSFEAVAVDEVIDAAAAKKKPPVKGGIDPSLEKKFFYRVLIIDVLQGNKEGGDNLIFIDIVHELFYEVPTTSVDNINASSQVIFDKISIEFSLNGCYLTVLGSALSDSCKIYSLKPASTITKEIDSPAINDVLKEDNNKKASPLVLTVPKLIAILPASASILESSRLKRVSIVPNYSNIITLQKNKNQSTNSDDNNINNESLKLFAETNMLVVSLHFTPKILLLGIRYKSEEEIAAKSAPLLDAKGKPIVAKVDNKLVSTTQEPPTVVLDLYLRTIFTLTSSICVYELDRSLNVLLVTGTSDGTVTLWNLAEQSMVDCLGKHYNIITCISIQRNYSSNLTALSEANVHIISGAADGTLCFFTTLPTSVSNNYSMNTLISNDNKKALMNSSKVRKLSSAGLTKSTNSLEHIGLSDYRDDIHKAAVLDIMRHDSLPIIYVQYSNGMMLMYDTFNNTLLGRLEKRERINFINIFTTMTTWRTLPTFEDPLKKAATIKKAADTAAAAELLRIQTATLEAEKAKKAGKPIPEVIPSVIFVEPPIIDKPVETNKEDIKVIEPVENEINLVPYPSITELLYSNNSFTSDISWYSYRFLHSMTSNHIVSICERNSKPCLVMFSLDSIYQDIRVLQSDNNSILISNTNLLNSIPSTSITKKSSYNSYHMNINSHKTQCVQDAYAHLDHQITRLDNNGTLIPIEQLRLTEERLHALENSFQKPINNLIGKTSNILPIIENKYQKEKYLYEIELDPVKITKLEMIRSKNEREKRKLKVISNNKNLMNILCNPSSSN